jgi:Do/DeqQ family serine protease
MIRLLCCLVTLSIGSALGAATVPRSLAQVQLSFAPVVQQAAPAVVNIYAKRIVATRVSPFANDPFFQDFFGDFSRVEPRLQNSLGSGVILTSDGMVVTNYHVVGQATDITVVLSDRREFQAQIVLADEDSDLAILSIENVRNLPYLPLRRGDSVDVGELVLAIGNPFGIGQTVSSGIISGLARSGTATGNARGYFLQTDAPINPGNSGGALVDMNAELLGVNTSILTRSGGSNGIGFAIPAPLVAQFLQQAQSGKTTFERPWAGVTAQPMDADIAASLGFDRPFGVLIVQLHPQSPFKAAGLDVGDIITAANGHEVNTPSELFYHLSVVGQGGRMTLSTVDQAGQTAQRAVNLMAPPQEVQTSQTPYRLRTAEVLEGLEILNLTPELRYEQSIPNGVEGVFVVDPGPVAGRIGVRQGDVIIGVGSQAVTDISALGPLLARSGRVLTITILRGGARVRLRAML